mmetsp:Transcript_29277/g.61748  ORF Transcript_29277/g.61748 Transcript_29277/m.61748 type:complete len:181 (+) Transcript_29277:107-649(+)
MNSIPIIDISPLVHLDERSNDSENERLKSVVSQISSACETFGFFAVTNHGVDPQIIANAWDTSKDFFDLDPSIKGSVPMTSEYPYGYENHESLGIERNNAAAATRMNPSSNLRPDSKETFSIGPLDNHRSSKPSQKWQKDNQSFLFVCASKSDFIPWPLTLAKSPSAIQEQFQFFQFVVR